jgi:hypothetical protein
MERWLQSATEGDEAKKEEEEEEEEEVQIR